jgi:hypothetical protein
MVLFMEVGSLVMERKMLIGIRERAERLARNNPARVTAEATNYENTKAPVVQPIA